MTLKIISHSYSPTPIAKMPYFNFTSMAFTYTRPLYHAFSSTSPTR
jgi:hypothetical protein